MPLFISEVNMNVTADKVVLSGAYEHRCRAETAVNVIEQIFQTVFIFVCETVIIMNNNKHR